MWLARVVFSNAKKCPFVRLCMYLTIVPGSVAKHCRWEKHKKALLNLSSVRFLHANVTFNSATFKLTTEAQISSAFLLVLVQVDNFFITERKAPYKVMDIIIFISDLVCFSMQRPLESLILAWELFKWKICLNRTAKNGWLLYQYRACCLTIAAFTLKLLG